MNRFFKTLRETVTDPGFGFAICNIMIFAGGGGVPFITCLAAAAVVVTTKFLDVYGFLEKNNALSGTLKDARTPLRVAGAAMAIVAGHALYAGLALPAFVSVMFGAFDFIAAEKIKDVKEQFAKSAAKIRKTGIIYRLKNLLTGSDLYAAAGLSGAALMAAPAVAAATIPFIAAGAAIAISNASKGRSESNGHPKIWSGLACIASGVTGIIAGGASLATVLPGLGLAVAGVVYVKIESQITEGGFKKVVSDIVSGPGRLLNKVLHRTHQMKPDAPEFISVIAPPVRQSRLPQAGALSARFGALVPAPATPPKQQPSAAPSASGISRK